VNDHLDSDQATLAAWRAIVDRADGPRLVHIEREALRPLLELAERAVPHEGASG
jgi:hypothetical protein